MKRTLWISVAVVTVFALSLNAMTLNVIAQPPGGQGGQRPGQGQAGAMGQMGGGASPAALLRNAEVIRMLALTEAQATSLGEVLRPGQRGQGGQGAQGGQFPGLGQGGTAAGAGVAAAMQQRNTEMWAGIDRVLNTGQQARFKEIYFQANGGMNALQLDSWMLAVVDLTPAQKESIDRIVAARTEATRAAGGFGGGQGGQQQQLTAEERQARTAAAQERNVEFTRQIREVLTAEQRTRTRQLTAGAAAMRETLELPALPPPTQGQGAGAGQRGQGAGAPGAAGQGQRGGGQGGAGGGGNFVPGQNTNNWQPGGQGAGGRGGQGAGGRQGGAGGTRGGGN